MAREAPPHLLEHLRRTLAPQTAAGVTDGELLDRFVRQRDEPAFELLVWRHQRMVWTLCRRLARDTADAEDAFQAAFLALALKGGSIGRREAVACWLYKVAGRAALKAGARRARDRKRRAAQGFDLTTLAVEDHALASADRREQWQALHEELQSLPPKYLAPVVLCYLEGKTYQEAAEELRCPKGTLSGWLTEARERLRARLEARGVALPAALATLLCQADAAPASARLVQSAARAAETASGPVLALTHEALNMTPWIRFKTTIALLAAAFLFGAAGLTARSLWGGPPGPVVAGGGAAAWQESARLRGATYGRVSPDSRTLVTVGDDHILRLWDTDSWRKRGEYDVGKRYARYTLPDAPFSPNGSTLAISGGVPDPGRPGKRLAEVTVLDSATAREVGRLPGSYPKYSPDGSLLLALDDDTVTLWDARTLRKKLALKAGGPLRLFEVEFSNDGRLLYAPTTAGRGHLWETATGKERAVLRGYQPRFAPDGKTLVTHLPGGAVTLWDTADGRERATPRAAKATGLRAEFSPDGKYLLTTDDVALKENGDRADPRPARVVPLDVRLWNPATGAELARLPGWDNLDALAAFSPDGKALVYRRLEKDENERQELVVWDLAARRERTVLRTPEGLGSAWFPPGGAMLLTSDASGNGLRLWDARSFRPLPGVAGVDQTRDLRFSPDGTMIVTPEGRPGGNGPSEDLLVFRLTGRRLPPPAVRGELPAPAPAEEKKQTPAGKELSDLRKEAEASEAERGAPARVDEEARVKLAGRAVQVARSHPLDPAAIEALEFALQATAGGSGKGYARVREDALKLFEAGHVESPRLGLVLHLLRQQHTDAADRLLEAVAEKSPHRAVRGRAAYLLAESLAEQSDLARLLCALPGFAKECSAEAVSRLGAADAGALARKAEGWYRRVRERYADVGTEETGPGRLGPAAERGLFVLRHLGIGKAAPDIEGVDLDGGRLKLSAYRGKVVVLVFSGHWCGPCRAMAPHKRKLVDRLVGQPFALLEVNSDADPEAVKRTMRREKLAWRCWADGPEGPIASRWNVTRWPAVFVLDGDGVIRYKDVRDQSLDRAVDAVLAERPRTKK